MNSTVRASLRNFGVLSIGEVVPIFILHRNINSKWFSPDMQQTSSPNPADNMTPHHVLWLQLIALALRSLLTASVLCGELGVSSGVTK